MFPGDTNDATTLAAVLADLAERFALRRICVVADRGLISVANVEAVTDAGFDHLLATKLRRDAVTAQALAAIDDDTAWVEIAQRRCRAADVALDDGTRAVVVESDARARRDTARTAEIVAATEAKLSALEDRVRAGRLKDPAKIGAAAQRILASVGAGRLFDTDIGPGRFLYHYNEDAHTYEELLAGPNVIATSLTPTQANTAQVVGYYRHLAADQARFRVVGDHLRLRPVRHWTEQRVRGHVAVLRLRRPNRNPHQPRPHRYPSPMRPQPHPPPPTQRQRPPNPPHHPAQAPTNPNTHRHRNRHPHLGQPHHHLTPPPARHTAHVVETRHHQTPPTRQNTEYPPNSGQTRGVASIPEQGPRLVSRTGTRSTGDHL
ncbi:MAG: hypothetical protein OXF41_16370 [bacterium]|nr:hypothetical protein [bacterium]